MPNPYKPPEDADDQQPQPPHWFAQLLANPTFGAFMAATLAAIIVLAGAVGMVMLWQTFGLVFTRPPDTPPEKRPLNLPQLILAASLAAAMLLISFDAPRWLIVLAGVSAALAAEELIRKG